MQATARTFAILCSMAVSVAAWRPAAVRAETASAQIQPAPRGATILSAPVLAPRSTAWVTVVDASGQPLAHVSVLVNGNAFETAGNGRAIFTVPNAGALILQLKTADGTPVARQDFCLLDNGVLCRDSAAAVVSDVLPATATGNVPELKFAPAVVTAGQTAVLLGSGFDGVPDNDRVLIDGEPATVLSSSANAILMRVPSTVPLGAIRQIMVGTTRGASVPLEADVARLDVSATTGTDMPGGVRIGLAGTNLPAMLQVTAINDASRWISAPDKKPVTDGAILSLPGGDENAVVISTDSPLSSATRYPTCKMLADCCELLPDAPARSADFLAVEQAMNYALLVKLKRRLSGVESLILKLRESVPLPGTNAADVEKRVAEERTLGVRQCSLATMIAAREQVFEANGGSTAQIKQALDDATGGACYVLEKNARPMTVISVNPVVAGAPLVVRPRFSAPLLREPRFKLWPPAPAAVAVSTVAPATSDTTNAVVKTVTASTAGNKSKKASGGGVDRSKKQADVSKGKTAAGWRGKNNPKSAQHRHHRRRHKAQ